MYFNKLDITIVSFMFFKYINEWESHTHVYYRAYIIYYNFT